MDNSLARGLQIPGRFVSDPVEDKENEPLPIADGAIFSYHVDLGHRFGSDRWLYTLLVRIDASAGQVTEAWVTG